MRKPNRDLFPPVWVFSISRYKAGGLIPKLDAKHHHLHSTCAISAEVEGTYYREHVGPPSKLKKPLRITLRCTLLPTGVFPWAEKNNKGQVVY